MIVSCFLKVAFSVAFRKMPEYYIDPLFFVSLSGFHDARVPKQAISKSICENISDDSCSSLLRLHQNIGKTLYYTLIITPVVSTTDPISHSLHIGSKKRKKEKKNGKE